MAAPTFVTDLVDVPLGAYFVSAEVDVSIAAGGGPVTCVVTDGTGEGIIGLNDEQLVAQLTPIGGAATSGHLSLSGVVTAGGDPGGDVALACSKTGAPLVDVTDRYLTLVAVAASSEGVHDGGLRYGSHSPRTGARPWSSPTSASGTPSSCC